MTETIEELEHRRKRRIYDDFMTAWDEQRKIQIDVEKRYNKGIFTLAAGSFGISFAFINQIVSLDNANHSILLVMAWLLMGITLIINIIDGFITYFIQDKLLDNIEANIERGYEGRSYKDLGNYGVLSAWIVKCLSLATFSAGVLLLLYFVYCNINI